MSVGLVLLQPVGYLLQTVPVILLFLGAMPTEYLTRPRKECIVSYFKLLLCLSLGFTIVDVATVIGRLMILSARDSYMLGSIFLCICYGKRQVQIGWKKALMCILLVVQYEAVVVSLNNMLYELGVVGTRTTWLEYFSGNVLGLLAINVVLFPGIYWMMVKLVRSSLPHIKGKILEHGCVYTTLSVLVYVIVATAFAPVFKTTAQAGALFAILVCNFITYAVYFTDIKLVKQQAIIEEQVNMMSVRYQMIQENIESTRRARHDMRHQINTIRVLCEQNNQETLGEFLKANEEELEKLEQKGRICPDPIVDSILEYYREKAVARGIHVTLDVRIHKAYQFEMMDMTSLLGNCLENAIEACEMLPETEERYLRIFMDEKNEMLLMEIENSCEDLGVATRGSFIGTKAFPSMKEGSHHGIGLESVELIARKYDGMVDYKREKGVFVIRIALKILKEDAVK